jgi:predicted ABC-type ATPase
MNEKNLYIIAGCNGAGKTTASFTILPEIIERRYLNGIKNLFQIYLPIVDGLLIFDNSEGKHELLAIKTIDGRLNIIDELKFNKLKAYDNS